MRAVPRPGQADHPTLEDRILLISRDGAPVWCAPDLRARLDAALLDELIERGESIFSANGRSAFDAALGALASEAGSAHGRLDTEFVKGLLPEASGLGLCRFLALGPNLFAIGFGDEARDWQFGTATEPDSFQTQGADQLRTDNVLMLCAESAYVAPWTIDPVTRRAWWSPLFFDLLGYEPGGFASTAFAFRELIHPDDHDAAVESMDALRAAAADKYHAIFRLRRKDGTWRWYEATAQMMETADGKSLVCGGLKDIHAEKEYELEREALLERTTVAQAEAQEALALAEHLRIEAEESEETLRAAAACGEIGPWSVTPATGEAWMLDETFRLLGYEPDAFLPTSEWWRKAIHPEDLPDALEAMEALIAGKSAVYSAQIRLRHADGTFHWYRNVARWTDRSDESLPNSITGTIIPIDDIKSKEDELAEALAAAEAATVKAQETLDIMNASSSSGEAVHWVRDLETGKTWFADGLISMLGLPPDTDFDPYAIRDYVHVDDVPKIDEQFDLIRSGKSETIEFQHRLRANDGSWFWVQARGRRLIRSAEGRSDIVCGMILNIENLKTAEKRLADSVLEAEALRAEAQETAEILRVSSENSGVVPWIRIPETDEFRFSDNITDLLDMPRGTSLPLDEWLARIHPEDVTDAVEGVYAVERGETDYYEADFRMRNGHGQYIWCRSAGRRIDRSDQGLPYMICGSQFSIDELKQNELRQAEIAAELQSANTRLQSIADNAPAGMYEYRRFPDGSFDLPYTSARFEELFGVTRAEIEASPSKPFEQVHPDDAERVMSSIAVSGQKMEHWSARFRTIHPTRGLRWLFGSSTPRRAEGGAICWIGVMSDVTEDVERENALKEAHKLAETMRARNEQLALHDALTELPNRRFFDQIFEERLDRARNGGPTDLCIIRLDLDKFKYINDTVGHEAGDMALRHIAQSMMASIRASDFVARIGGDEFSILLSPGCDESSAETVIERVRERLEAPISLGNRRFHVRASYGIARVEDVRKHGHDVQFFADTALYTAKDAGRDRVQIFTPSLHESLLDGRSLSADLEDALHSDQFVPYFQPQVSARTGQLVGIETLLRWNHPTRGVLTPDKFMSLAEQVRLMPEIDKLTFHKAIEIVRDWELEGLSIPKISFNISSGRMRDSAILVDTDLNKNTLKARITFELLESILIENESEEFKKNLDFVRGQGIDIEIDDFGSGHASIISIMALSPSALKIDRRLVWPIGKDAKNLDVIRGIISIAEALDVETIAEGVETEEQARLLAEVGCHHLQGYLFARPLSADNLRTYLIDLANRPSSTGDKATPRAG